jgi:hypothetical protein
MSQAQLIEQKPSNIKSFPYRLPTDVFNLHARNFHGMNVIVSEIGKIAYAPIPKNACTSLKIFFHGLVKGVPFNGPFDEVHSKFTYAAVDFEKFSADRDHFKFCVVRDPLERFVSAFNNRVIHYRELSRDWVLAHSQNATAVIEIFETKKLKFNPTLSEFTDRLEDYIAISNSIRHHFIPQQNFFHARPEAFDRVYTIEMLPDLAKDIAARTGKKVEFPRVQETAELKNPARLSDLSSRQIRKLIMFYVDDYKILKPYLK